MRKELNSQWVSSPRFLECCSTLGHFSRSKIPHSPSSTNQSWLFSQTMLSRFFLRHVKIHGSLFRPCQMSFQRSPIRTTGLFSCRRQHQNAFPPPRSAEYLPPPKPQRKDKSKAVRYSINGATGVATIMAVTLGAIFWHCREQDPVTRRKILKLFLMALFSHGPIVRGNLELGICLSSSPQHLFSLTTIRQRSWSMVSWRKY